MAKYVEVMSDDDKVSDSRCSTTTDISLSECDDDDVENVVSPTNLLTEVNIAAYSQNLLTDSQHYQIANRMHRKKSEVLVAQVIRLETRFETCYQYSIVCCGFPLVLMSIVFLLYATVDWFQEKGSRTLLLTLLSANAVLALFTFWVIIWMHHQAGRIFFRYKKQNSLVTSS